MTDHTIYRVLYGSHAHGTTTETSDEDWRGVYVVPNRELLGLHPPARTREGGGDDVSWEVGHFARLLLKGNPNIVGMLWAPEDCVRVSEHTFWTAFVRHRQAFITERAVDAYLSWARSEVGKLDQGGPGQARGVTAKRLSHVPRLLWEIEGAVTDREVRVRLTGERLATVMAIKTGVMSFAEASDLIGQLLLDVEATCEEALPKLPAPPEAFTERALLAIRHELGGSLQ